MPLADLGSPCPDHGYDILIFNGMGNVLFLFPQDGPWNGIQSNVDVKESAVYSHIMQANEFKYK